MSDTDECVPINLGQAWSSSLENRGPWQCSCGTTNYAVRTRCYDCSNPCPPLETKRCAKRRRASEGDTIQYFSQQELTRDDGRSIADRGKLHTPVDEPSKQALEICLVAMAGRQFHWLKCTLFCLFFIGWGVAMGFALNWYCYAPPFGGEDAMLDPLQSNLGIAGFFGVFYGASCLLMMWLPGLFSMLTCAACPLRDATHVLLYCDDGTKEFVSVSACAGPDGVSLTRVVTFRKLRFVLDHATGDFEAEGYTDPVMDGVRLGLGHTDGLMAEEHAKRKHWYGINLIDVPIPSIPSLLVHEVSG